MGDCLRILSRLLLLIFPVAVSAQSNKDSSWDAYLLAGPMLPQNITGYHEVIMTSGVRVAKGVGAFRPGVYLLTGNEGGAEYLTLGGDFRNNITLEEVDGVGLNYLVGLQMVQYKRAPRNGVEFKEVQGSGFHLGLGVAIPFTRNFSFVNDYLWCLGPGRILVVNLGLKWTFGGSTENP